MKNEVTMTVNQANLVNSLKYSFTNNTTVLGEIMQNSRRAGASFVSFYFDPQTQVLRITDNGCGIKSLEALLTVAESGWDSETMAQEHPFGIGFLSALFACVHLTIRSKSGLLAVDTKTVLSFQPVAIEPVLDWDGITEIILTGVDLTFDQITDELQRLSSGFPIQVILNGESLDRPFAMDSALKFIKTSIGDVYLQGFDRPGQRCDDYVFFLQGLPIYQSVPSRLLHGQCHFIHLDSSRFFARLPDRDKLINENDIIKQIVAVLALEIEARLASIKHQCSAKEFVRYFSMMQAWRCLHLLNDVPLVPPEALQEIVNYPVCNTDNFDAFLFNPNEALSQSEIEASGVVSINDDVQYEGAERFLFAQAKGYLIYQGTLDKAHWIHNSVRHNLSSEAVKLELINETHTAVFKGQWAWLGVRFCDAYRIHVGDDHVHINDIACYEGEDAGTAVLPKNDNTGEVLKQSNSFCDEFDAFQASTFEADEYLFESFVVANTTPNPADAIKRLLPVNYKECPVLHGQSFILNIDETGKLASIAVV